MFQSLTVHLLKAAEASLRSNINSGMDDFEAKNENQFFKARTLAIVFIQTTMLDRFNTFIKNNEEGFLPNELDILKELGQIYGLWSLEKHLGHLFEYGVLANPGEVGKVHSLLLSKCTSLKGNAVALVDVLAPPDFVLNSVLGNSDGQVYKHLQRSFYETPTSFKRPPYWAEIIDKSKL